MFEILVTTPVNDPALAATRNVRVVSEDGAFMIEETLDLSTLSLGKTQSSSVMICRVQRRFL